MSDSNPETLSNSGGKKAVIYHSTAYDASWEKAAIKQSCPIVGLTTDLACQKLAATMLKNHLLTEWKSDSGVIKGTKYVSACPNLPEEISPPELLVCKQVDNTLTIPQDIRQRWLQDPVRSGEWKKLIQKFQQLHGSPSESTAGAAAAPATPAVGTSGAVTSPPAADGQAADGEDLWKNVFEGEPRKLEDLVTKYGEPVATFAAPGSSGFQIKVTEGPKFWLYAPVAGTFDCLEFPILAHGAGNWLLDSKAEKALTDTPDKVHLAKFESDLHLCVLEAWVG